MLKSVNYSPGPVLRNVLLQLLPEELRQYCADDTQISVDALSVLTKAFGAKLEVHDEQQRQLDYLELSSNPQWTIQLHHSEKGGGHWDFSYQDSALDAAHSTKFQINQYGQREPIGCQEMWQVTNKYYWLKRTRCRY